MGISGDPRWEVVPGKEGITSERLAVFFLPLRVSIGPTEFEHNRLPTVFKGKGRMEEPGWCKVSGGSLLA